jgi:cytochrome c biogenesis protein CcdA
VLQLALIWSGIGLLIALMAYAARLQPMSRRNSPKRCLFLLLIMGVLISFGSGWLGVVLFGRLFSTAMVLWLTIAGIIIFPWLIVRIQTGLQRKEKTQIHGKTPFT